MEGAGARPFGILDELRDENAGRTVGIPVTGRNLPASKVEQVMALQ